jgi:transcription antitermination factor NusG
VWQLPHVAQVLKPPSQASFLRELQGLFRLINSGVPITPEEQLQPGQAARITRGCLAGISGTVIENRNGMKLIVGTSLLGRGASVEVTPDMVERI